MRICPNCKTTNFDMDTKCNKCGYPLRVKPYEKVVACPSDTVGGNTVFVVRRKSNALSNSQRVARAFMIISCIVNILSFWALLVFLYWLDNLFTDVFNIINIFSADSILNIVRIKTIVYIVCYVLILLILSKVILSICITNSYNRKIVNDKKVGIAFAILTLIFVNRTSGILILCDSSK